MIKGFKFFRSILLTQYGYQIFDKLSYHVMGHEQAGGLGAKLILFVVFVWLNILWWLIEKTF